ncbi:hypothetical protein CRG98_019228 [Punica granatum]|uniref:Uncharacterized protein n=1 Tax=Punica granatum TaxID=22663 RepID=A0A2I0JVP1_PUNGR|nr:hypothetical protein CRG98_019228 [Punica granatum]
MSETCLDITRELDQSNGYSGNHSVLLQTVGSIGPDPRLFEPALSLFIYQSFKTHSAHSGHLPFVLGCRVLVHPTRTCHPHDTKLLLDTPDTSFIGPGDLAVCIRFSRGDIRDEWSRRGHASRESDRGFLGSVVDHEGKGVILRVLVPPRGAYRDHVDGRPLTRPMVREGVVLHSRGLDGIEGEPVAVDPLLDLVSQPPTIIESVPRRALMILAAFRLILNGRVKIRARGYRSDLIACKESSIYGSAAPVEELSTPGAWVTSFRVRSGGRTVVRPLAAGLVEPSVSTPFRPIGFLQESPDQSPGYYSSPGKRRQTCGHENMNRRRAGSTRKAEESG